MVHSRSGAVAGVVVAGGQSRRMGFDKAFISWRGRPLITYPLAVMKEFFDEVFIVAKKEEGYADFGVPVFLDAYPAQGALIGIYSALMGTNKDWALVAACDMPLIKNGLVDLLLDSMEETAAVVVPRTPSGPEPLLALYHRRCLTAMDRRLPAGDLRISSLLDELPVRYLSVAEVAGADPDFASFINLNTPRELEAAAGTWRGGEPPS